MQLPNLVANTIRYVKRILGFADHELREDNKVSVDVQSGMPNRSTEMEHLQLQEKVKSVTEENMVIKSRLRAIESALGNNRHKIRILD